MSVPFFQSRRKTTRKTKRRTELNEKKELAKYILFLFFPSFSPCFSYVLPPRFSSVLSSILLSIKRVFFFYISILIYVMFDYSSISSVKSLKIAEYRIIIIIIQWCPLNFSIFFWLLCCRFRFFLFYEGFEKYLCYLKEVDCKMRTRFLGMLSIGFVCFIRHYYRLPAVLTIQFHRPGCVRSQKVYFFGFESSAFEWKLKYSIKNSVKFAKFCRLPDNTVLLV